MMGWGMIVCRTWARIWRGGLYISRGEAESTRGLIFSLRGTSSGGGRMDEWMNDDDDGIDCRR